MVTVRNSASFPLFVSLEYLEGIGELPEISTLHQTAHSLLGLAVTSSIKWTKFLHTHTFTHFFYIM
jgi:hypothetical protein